MEIDPESTVDSVTEEVFENERYFGFKWGDPFPNERPRWSSIEGEAREEPRDADDVDDGWEWQDGNWIVDTERAVDKDGWEYAVTFRSEWYPGALALPVFFGGEREKERGETVTTFAEPIPLYS